MITLNKIGDYHNRQLLEIECLKSDEKPIGTIDGLVITNGSKLHELDGDTYEYDEQNKTWVLQPKSSGGADGREIELQKTQTHIQWRYVGTEEWFDLVSLDEISFKHSDFTPEQLQALKGAKGDKGDPGTNGTNGKDGLSIKSTQINDSGHLILTFSDESTKDVGKVTGENGESAYQIAVRLGFHGTEQEWIESLEYDHSEEFTKLAEEVRNTASNIAAERQQITQSSEDIARLKEDLSRVEKDTYVKKEIEKEKKEWVDIDLTSGYSDGCFDKDKKRINWTNMNYSHHVYDVKEGEKYKINARVPDANIPLIVFTDIENNTIDFLPNPITTVRITSEVIIPAGSTKMYVNHNGVTDNTNSYYLWELSKYVVTPAVIEKKPIKDYVVSNLFGKKIVCNGDSIVKGQGYYGDSKGDKSYVNIIAEKYNMNCINYAVSGGTLSSGSNVNVHHICDDVMNMDVDADYIIVGGGYNDWLYNTPLGEITNNYTDEVNANGRVVGGAELLCRNLLSRFKGKKVGFVFSHKIKESPYTQNKSWDNKPYTMTECHDEIVSVLRKYSIPYLDLYNDSALNTALSDYLLYTANSDGTHPTKEGYEIFYCDKFENFLLSL